MNQFIKCFTSTTVHDCSNQANRWISKNADVEVITVSASPPVYSANRGLGISGLADAACLTLLCRYKEGTTNGNI